MALWLGPLVPLVSLLMGIAGSASADAVVGAAGAAQGGIYFPLRSVELKLWVDGKSGNLLPPPGGVLLSPQLLSDEGRPETTAVTFRLTDPAKPDKTPALPWLAVDSKTGVIKVTAQRVLGDNGAQRQHAVWLEARGPAAQRAPPHRSARPFMVPADRARINITITLELMQEERACANKDPGTRMARDDPCHYCHDSCFWQSAEIQVWENKPATRLATIGHSYTDVHCGDGNKYTLKNGTEHFEIRESDLWSRDSLDRDVLHNASASQRGPGPFAPLSIECKTSWGTTEERVVAVFVLDEDDNAPVLEKDEKLSFNFSTETALARGAHILVKDMDSRAVNRFSELQVVDPSGVVTHKKLEFDVTHGGVQHTLVSIRLQVKDPMEANYKVALKLTDITLANPEKKDLKMNVTLWGPPLTPPVAMSSSGSSGSTATTDSKPKQRRRRRSVKSKSTEPMEQRVQIWSHARQHARLGQVGALEDGYTYRLAGPDPPAWVGITRLAGIAYVKSPDKLPDTKGLPHTVVVEAVNKSGVAFRSHVLVVDIKESGNSVDHPCLNAKSEICAQFKKAGTCVKGCGPGAGGNNSGPLGGCVWRAGKPSKHVIDQYATCTVHEPTCPDRTCDPLEKMDPAICPQDCTGV